MQIVGRRLAPARLPPADDRRAEKGAPPRIFARMLVNVAVEGIVGAIPIAGGAFDVAFRTNRRNVRLLRDHFDGRL